MADTPPYRRLDDLRLTEVSGVDHPAHQEEGWLVLKSQRPSQEAQPMEPINKEALDPEVRAHIESLESELAVAKAAATETPAPEPTTESPEESFAKALEATPEPIRKALEEAQERIAKAESEKAAAEEEVRKAADAALTEEFVAKAATLDSLSVEAAEFGPILRKATEALGEDAVKLFDVLKAANDAVAASAAMSETGANKRPAATTAGAQIEALAKARSTEAGISFAEAMTVVAQENPDLYTQHITESRKGA